MMMMMVYALALLFIIILLSLRKVLTIRKSVLFHALLQSFIHLLQKILFSLFTYGGRVVLP